MNELKPMVLIHFPKDWDEIMDWIKEHPKSEQQSMAIAAGMAWNLAWTMHVEDKSNDDT